MSETKSSTEDKATSTSSSRPENPPVTSVGAESNSEDTVDPMSDVTSLASSADEDVGVFAYAPNAITNDMSRKSSWIGRLSDRADSYFSNKEELLRNMLLNLTDQEIAHEHNDWFGGDGFRRCYSRQPVTDTESNIGPHDVGSQTVLQSELKDEQPPNPPLRRKSTIATIGRKLGFWDEEFQKWRMVMVLSFIKNYIIIILGFMVALSIYWGAFYDRPKYYHRLKYAVILGEDTVNGIPPILSSTVDAFFQDVPQLKAYGTFHFFNYTTINGKASQHNRTITEQVVWEIRHRKYWAIFYVKPNATYDWYQSMVTATPKNISTSLMSLYISTGNDYNAYNNAIRSIIMSFYRFYYAFIPQSNLTYNMASLVNSTQLENIIDNAPDLLTTIPSFEFIDIHPVIKQVYQGPLQIGLIYLLTFTFFQYLFSKEIQAFAAEKLQGAKYIIARMAISQANYVIIGLSYALLNRAFGIDFNLAFGKAGFLVVWAFAALTCSAIGSVVELLGIIAFTFNPAFIGFVMLGNVVLNLTPVVSPPILCNRFYRYGYAMPIYASYRLMMMVYFDTDRTLMGLCIGILCAWVVVSNAVSPFIMRWVSNVAARKQAAAAAEKAG